MTGGMVEQQNKKLSNKVTDHNVIGFCADFTNRVTISTFQLSTGVNETVAVSW
jgi:hypothetical protein